VIRSIRRTDHGTDHIAVIEVLETGAAHDVKRCKRVLNISDHLYTEPRHTQRDVRKIDGGGTSTVLGNGSRGRREIAIAEPG